MNKKIEKCGECRFFNENTCHCEPEKHFRQSGDKICAFMEEDQSDEGIEVTLPDATWCRGPQV
jgi:hypothetical protein